MSWRRVAERAGTESIEWGAWGGGGPGRQYCSVGESGPAPACAMPRRPGPSRSVRPPVAPTMGRGPSWDRGHPAGAAVRPAGSAWDSGGLFGTPTGREVNTGRRARSWICMTRLYTDGWGGGCFFLFVCLFCGFFLLFVCLFLGAGGVFQVITGSVSAVVQICCSIPLGPRSQGSYRAAGFEAVILARLHSRQFS